jgi:small subunit ribosomal protein S1
VELEPGVEGLIHLSEMSWSKKARKPSDVVKPGDTVEAVVLFVNPGERRISLGLRQALGDPWADAQQKYPVGGVVEGPVVSLTKFGAFVEIAEGVEGMIHVGDITAEKRINHPQDVLRAGQTVRAQILEVDTERRRIRLGMKQLQPTSIDEYIAEHKEGDVVTGRIADVSGGRAKVELGEGIQVACKVAGAEAGPAEEQAAQSEADVTSLSSMLSAKWKGGTGSGPRAAKREPARAGQIRSFRIVKLDAGAKKIEIEMVG